MQVSTNEQGYAHTCPTEPQPSSHETNKETQNQFFTISLDADLASIGNLEEYVRELRQDLAYAADIDPKFIRFASLRAGSIINVLWVEPGAGEPIKVVRELQLQVNDCNSRLLSGKWTSKTIGLVIAGEGRGEQQLMVELSKLKVQLQLSGVPDRAPEIAHGTKPHNGEGTPPIPRPATPPTKISEYAAQAYYDPTFSGKVELDLKPPSEASSSPPVKQPTVQEEVAAWIDTIAKLSGKVQITKQISLPFSQTCVGRCLFRMRTPCHNVICIALCQDTLWGFDDELGEWERDVAVEYFDEAPTYEPPKLNPSSQGSRQRGTSQDVPEVPIITTLPTKALYSQPAATRAHYPENPSSPSRLISLGSIPGEARDYTRPKAFTGSGAGESAPQHWLNQDLAVVQETPEQRAQREGLITSAAPESMDARQVRCSFLFTNPYSECT
jgi:hypothetical protein